MSTPVSPEPQPVPSPRPRNVPLLVILGVIGVLLLAVIVLLAFILFSPTTVTTGAPVTASPTSTVTSAPNSSTTPGATSSAAASNGAAAGTGTQSKPTPTPTTPTAAKKPLMQVFNTHGVQVVCVTGTDAVPAQLNFDLTFDYSARDTTAVYIGVDTDDAVANPFDGPLPAVGSVTVPFSCYGPHTYSFAAVGADGSRDEGSVTFVNHGDPDPYAK
ncbi:hypothetical protein [Subtercola lobariae]|nr:hypothetical protein [Subtercola lobariae]